MNFSIIAFLCVCRILARFLWYRISATPGMMLPSHSSCFFNGVTCLIHDASHPFFFFVSNVLVPLPFFFFFFCPCMCGGRTTISLIRFWMSLSLLTHRNIWLVNAFLLLTCLIHDASHPRSSFYQMFWFPCPFFFFFLSLYVWGEDHDLSN